MASSIEMPNPAKPYFYQAQAAGIPALFAEAQTIHQAQRYPEAEALYRRIVEADPRHIGAWHLLGLVCVAQDKLPESAEGFGHVLELSPQHIDALTQLGIVLARQSRLPEAVARFRQAIELKPDHAKAHNNLGVALTQLGRQEEGLACYQEAARLQPDYAEAHFNVGVTLGDRKQNGEALAAYERAVQARPDYADALFNLGMLLVHERRPADAVAILEQAARLRPDNSEAHNNLSLALADLGRFEDAVASCNAALRLRPLDAKTHMNRGNALASLGRVEEGLACYDLALRLQPDYASARWNRSLAWLVQGEYERGWAEYEWRWQRQEARTRNFPEPRWDGTSLAGKTILLWCEQGLGDTIQFIRYARLLHEQGAVVWLECPAKLIPLLTHCPGLERLIPEGTPLPAGFDCHAPLMSLPHLCKTTLGNVPAGIPYLASDPADVDHWRAELGPLARLKVGVAWQGNPLHRFDQHRSFSPHWFGSLTAQAGVQLYSLQKGEAARQLKNLRFPLVDLGSRLDETGGAFRETAALMQALDLVITCDSALAHLAGALGVPVWVPLSTPADWRWLLDVEDSPWYPAMRLFRQPKLGQWGPVFQRMGEVLAKWVPQEAASLVVEVAPGELLDKLTILQIKSARIADADKLASVRAELAVVEATRKRSLRESPELTELVNSLKEVNERLWDIENQIRDCETAEDFGAPFIRLARGVYQTNDRRAAIKRQINVLLGAAFREEKEYRGK
jgi:tetratricopeptide (TPR) repeat protein